MKGISDFRKKDNYEIFVNEIENFVKVNDLKISDTFFYPKSCEIYNKKIYVSDSMNCCIKMFDLEGNIIKEFGNDILLDPYCIRIFNDDLFVVNKDIGKISVFDLDGKYKFDFSKKMSLPTFLEISNNKIYVMDSNKNSINIFNINGEFELEIELDLNNPLGIKLYKENIIIADEFNKRVISYNFLSSEKQVISSGVYYSLLEIKDDILFTYDEKTGEFFEFKLEEIFNNKIEKTEKELAYELIYQEKFEEAKIYFDNKENWDKTKNSENIKMKDYLNNKDFDEFILKYIDDKMLVFNNKSDEKYYLKEIKRINEYNSQKLDKLKALFIKDNKLFFSLQLFRAFFEVDLEDDYKLNNLYTFNHAPEKVGVIDNKFYFLDFFNKKISVVNEESLKTEYILGEKIIKRASDLKIISNKIYVLDSENKKVFVFNDLGKKLKSFDIEGIECNALEEKDGIFYILDKRGNKLFVYDQYFNKIDEHILEGVIYPEDLAIDNNNNIYVSDEVNKKIVKYDKNYNFIYQKGGFAMPRDLLFNDNKLYVADYNNKEVIIFEVR